MNALTTLGEQVVSQAISGMTLRCQSRHLPRTRIDSRTSLNILRNCWPRCGLAAAGLVTGIAFGQTNSELVGLINSFRSEPQSCQGQRIDVVGPLGRDAALARVKPGAGVNLLEAARKQGYQAARLEAIWVSGPTDAAAAIKLIRERYCRQLRSPRYAQIGVSRIGVAWQILLARPVVSADLGQWERAGREILRLISVARTGQNLRRPTIQRNAPARLDSGSGRRRPCPQSGNGESKLLSSSW